MVSGMSPSVPVAVRPLCFYLGTDGMFEEDSGTGMAGPFRKTQLLYLSAASAVLLRFHSACTLRKNASADSSGLFGLYRVQPFDPPEYHKSCSNAEAARISGYIGLSPIGPIGRQERTF